jgi:hypothetical protein
VRLTLTLHDGHQFNANWYVIFFVAGFLLSKNGIDRLWL